MKIFAVSLLLAVLIPHQGRADVSDLFKADNYRCEIIGILDSDVDDFFEFDFNFSIQGTSKGSHGGRERIFTFKDHKVVAIADDRWLGMAWWIGGKKIGETVTVSTETASSSRVVLLMNPNNDEERVSISCDLLKN